jgi:enamine deaminase RidA (YjgF/YER057c/UK114 family)
MEPVLTSGQPLLGGCPLQMLCVDGGVHSKEGAFEFLENDDFLAGFCQIPVDAPNLESVTFEIYEQLLRKAEGFSICRIWNYVPEINVEYPDLIENYRLFCSGRSLAFESFSNGSEPIHYPAASATGTAIPALSVVFLATRFRVENWENPEQTPAYRYPLEYGPRAPAFARASRFSDSSGDEWIFVSGTAAIKGSSTISTGDFSEQLNLTLENIDLVLRGCDLSLSDRDSNRPRHFYVFLRDESDYSKLLERMNPLLGINDSISVVKGDICRSDLMVEIELTVCPRSSGAHE